MTPPKPNSWTAHALRLASRSKTSTAGARKPTTDGSPGPARKRSKYGNQPCEIGGQKYRSKREAARHQQLLSLEAAGLLANLRREVPFVLAPAVKIAGRTKPALRYVADFVYTDTATGLEVVEDCKGMRTDVYRIKRHLMKTTHGVDIVES